MWILKSNIVRLIRFVEVACDAEPTKLNLDGPPSDEHDRTVGSSPPNDAGGQKQEHDTRTDCSAFTTRPRISLSFT